MLGWSNPEARMSCCFSSSRLRITRRFGRYSFSMISTNFLPNDPVPPVTRTACSDQFIPCASLPPKSDNRAGKTASNASSFFHRHSHPERFWNRRPPAGSRVAR